MAPIEELLQKTFIAKKLTLSLAESCTGGGVAAKLVLVPDSSRYFLGGIVAYSNLAKSRLLGVSPSLIQAEGAVSERVALEMAKGAQKQFGSHFSLAVTGLAGPLVGGEKKAVGTVCFAICGAGERVWTKVFKGQRSEIIGEAIQESLLKLQQVGFEA